MIKALFERIKVRPAFIWFALSIIHLVQEKTSFADNLKCQKERKWLTKSLAFTEWAAVTINRFVDRLVGQSIARLITIIEWTDSLARCNLSDRSSVYPSKFRARSSEVPLLFFAGELERRAAGWMAFSLCENRRCLGRISFPAVEQSHALWTM